MTSRRSISLLRLFAAAATLALGWLVTPAVAQNAYITNSGDGTVSVIDTTTNTVSATITVGNLPFGVAVTSDGSKVYVPNPAPPGRCILILCGSVSVIDTATNTVVATIPNVGNLPQGVAVTPDGSKVYVALQGTSFQTGPPPGTVSVIDAATNSLATGVNVGNFPTAFGIFIQPRFAGTAKSPSCFGTTVAVLAKQHGGLPAAATALGFTSVAALQNAITGFCGS
jgi:YVTN family beta-propeller protein